MTTKITKTPAKKTPAKKAPAKKAPAKSASTKTAANKTAANKTAAKKTAANKTAANKTAANKTAANKTAAKPTTKAAAKPVTTKAAAKTSSSTAGSASAVRDALRAYAFGLPGAWEDHPWGESVAKVGKKVFVFFGKPDDDDPSFGLSVKLPTSSEDVLSLSFAEPTGYGLGKAGWVSLTLLLGQHPPVEAMCEWIEESFRAVAPKTQVRALDAR